jgi:hypothetical protein
MIQYSDIFIDLNKSIEEENKTEIRNKKIGIAAIGGFPIQIKDNKFLLLNNELTKEFVNNELTKALGMGAILTYKNKSNKSNLELGALCFQKGHFWSFNSINLSVAFFNVPVFCEISFARDGRFHLSWVEDKILPENMRTFTATAPLKVWKKYLSYKDDESFLRTQRMLLTETNIIFNNFYSAYFPS